MKIFIDCSFVYNNPELNTGIQRVVKRVVQNFYLLSQNREFEVVLVKLNAGSLNEISKDSIIPKKQSRGYLSVIKRYLKRVFKSFRTLIVKLLPFERVRRFVYTPRDHFGLNYIVDLLLIKPLRYIILQSTRPATQSTKNITTQQEDILLLLDSTWHLDIWHTVQSVRQRETRVVAVIYDLIPITHSHFCDDSLVALFKKWFYNSSNYVDKYIAISNSVQKDLTSFFSEKFPTKVEQKEFDHFLLGSDFHHQETNSSYTNPSFKNIFKKDTYILVSTIEPRKNHIYLLDVFDKLWDRGFDINLLFIGRVGWKVESLMRRIKNHQRVDENLFYLCDLDDLDLNYAYENSKMLLFPSIVEGFGLPIVEALMHKLPVLASDTPIHREVGGDKIGYFDIESIDSLVEQIIKIEQDGIPKELQVDTDYRQRDWYSSSQDLLQKVIG
jgi:alpha-1,2-rhamnosyltransferase